MSCPNRPALLALFIGLTISLAAAVPPPASVGNLVFSYNSGRPSEQREVFLQSDGSCYDLYHHDGSLGSDLPLRIGTYTYTVNPDDTATIALSFPGETLRPYPLTFDTPTSGSGSFHSSPFPDTLFGVSPLVDGGHASNLSARSLVNATTPSIAGFIIQGDHPRLCLLRAVGPTLANYGVTDAVSDVSLELHSGATVLASNDDWSVPTPAPDAGFVPTPADFEHAFAAAGAFPLAQNSKDAALLVILPPGTYTALARSPDAGEVLVELYLVP
ncbi:hypothetical protein K0B96_00865 [Horticoccus luteus]|uniref:DUF4397 domain-containing protein n=1 Tax=Horticoccus luteus TaxID=2862869 RepID=A0A8F9TTX3_9BACT|nr:hypothetical protein [Horticoccus luteus]QYM79199.1 hypothetical protein K0B96_00865 [Horticoccus luteus]